MTSSSASRSFRCAGVTKHLRHADPKPALSLATGSMHFGRESTAAPQASVSANPGITLHFDEVVLPGTSDRFWGAMRFDTNGHGRSGSQADSAA